MSDDLQAITRIIRTLRWIMGGVIVLLGGTFSAGMYVDGVMAQQRMVVERQAAINAEVLRRIDQGDKVDSRVLDELKNNKATLMTHESRITNLETDMRDVRNSYYGRTPR